jgi:hypothetical protein
MADADADWMTTVLRSGDGDDPAWRLQAGWTRDGHLMTTLCVEPDGKPPTAAGGFGGPPVWDGEVINTWYGTAGEGASLYAVVRTLPQVQAVWVTLGATTHTMALTEADPDFGVRFGVCKLTTDRSPADLRPAFSAT